MEEGCLLNKPKAMCDISLLCLVPAESCVECQQSIRLPGFQLLLIDIILALVSASKIEKSGTNRFALLLLPSSLLDKSSKGRQTCARANHDDRRAWSVGQAELRPPDIDGDTWILCILPTSGGLLVPEPGGGHPHVGPASARLILHHHTTDVDTGGVQLGTAGNGVEPGLQSGQKLQDMVNGRLAGVHVL